MTSKLKMFRCYRDPHIPPKPRNAFTLGTGQDQLPGTAELSDYGVLVKMTAHGERHFIVPWANVECIELEKEAPKTEKLKTAK